MVSGLIWRREGELIEMVAAAFVLQFEDSTFASHFFPASLFPSSCFQLSVRGNLFAPLLPYPSLQMARGRGGGRGRGRGRGRGGGGGRGRGRGGGGGGGHNDGSRRIYDNYAQRNPRL